jgi:hypothetical protein
VSAFNRYCGVDVQEISPREVQRALPARAHRRHPRGLLREGGRAGRPGGRDDGAGEGGAAAGRDDRRGRGRRPGADAARRGDGRGAPRGGDIECEYVVNCAGMWARQLGRAGGRDRPAAGGRALLPHHRADRGGHRDRGRCSRTRRPTVLPRGGGGLMIGLFEPICAPWKVEGMPDDFSFGEIAPDWERMGPYLERAMAARADLAGGGREEVLLRARRASRPTCGPASARRPSSRNYFVAAGPQLHRHPDRRRAGARAGALDHPRAA